jgi:hypothetical protein
MFMSGFKQRRIMMKLHSLILIPVVALASCGDSLRMPDLPESTFYDRTVVAIDGQTYTVATRPAEFGGSEQYFVFVNGRYYECEAPTAEGCIEAVRGAMTRGGGDSDY